MQNSHKKEIEDSIGEHLIWDRGDDWKSSKIFYKTDGAGIDNEEDWPLVTKFPAKRTVKLYEAIVVPYLKPLYYEIPEPVSKEVETKMNSLNSIEIRKIGITELDTDAIGVYYDGVYYLSYSTEEAMFDDLCAFDTKGIPFAIDGSAKVCGGLITYQAGVINPNATTKIAVIDTGSDLANEKYSVIGDDLKDHNGHGTAMVNNILAQTDDAYVISIKTMADDGTGNVSDICAAVQLATDLKVDIIFMALSFKDSGDYDAFKKLVNEAQNQKITFIVSAGNNSA